MANLQDGRGLWVHWGLIRIGHGGFTRNHWGNIRVILSEMGMMDKKMETITRMGYTGFRAS